MQITILNVSKLPAVSKAGKPYNMLNIAFTNNTYGGKVEGKKLTPFGENEATFKTLESAISGSNYEITVVKNAAGFNDWTSAKLSDGAAAPATAPQGTQAANKSVAYAPTKSTYETPEERAQRQVYIIRQSSISSAVAALVAGAKAAPSAEAVLTLAKEFEAYVFSKPEPAGNDSGFDDMSDDVPV